MGNVSDGVLAPACGNRLYDRGSMDRECDVYLLFATNLATRRVKTRGSTRNPSGENGSDFHDSCLRALIEYSTRVAGRAASEPNRP